MYMGMDLDISIQEIYVENELFLRCKMCVRQLSDMYIYIVYIQIYNIYNI